ncbi:MAG: hypothetical protein GU359_09965 [Desulfurococcales archaeon]|nr:hypothetical protein [Desulfurococcales archaeon]
MREIYRRAGLERIDEIRKLVEDSDPLSIGSMLNYLMIMRGRRVREFLESFIVEHKNVDEKMLRRVLDMIKILRELEIITLK